MRFRTTNGSTMHRHVSLPTCVDAWSRTGDLAPLGSGLIQLPTAPLGCNTAANNQLELVAFNCVESFPNEVVKVYSRFLTCCQD